MSDSAAVKKAHRVKLILIWTNVAIGAIALFALLIGGTCVAYARMYDGKFFPGVEVLGVRLDNLTPEEGQKEVNEAIDATLAKGLRFRYQGHDVNIDPTPSSADAGDARDLVNYQIDDAMRQAMKVGREGNWLEQTLVQMRLRVVPVHVPAVVAVDRKAIAEALDTALQSELTPPQNAHFVADSSTVPVTVSIVPEKDGTVLLPEHAFDALTTQAQNLDFEPIALSDRIVKATVTVNDLEPLKPAAQEFLSRPQLVFAYNDKKFPVSTSTLATWVTATGTPGSLSVTIDPAAFASSISDVAPGIEVAAKDGSLVIKDGKIESFAAGMQGLAIDAQATLAPVLSSWPASNTFPLVVTPVTAKLAGEDPQRLGITDLLGVGTSNFSGSPANRIKNITHGANLVNGTIVQPGETFSLLKTLGPIDGEHKWLPELVIKGNETKPEFGGGLCQIGTTTFRGALASGLPIVQRANHSYRVRYYEPAGLDATIYDPRPDFQFQNDTAHPVLINAYIKGNDVFFEFWGTKDGRKSVYTGTTVTSDLTKLRPRVYNVVQPPPTKLVETLNLKPGAKKCTEVAHAGADTDFNYAVTYADGTLKSTDFHSHYRPWQAVCLIGVEHLSAPTDTTTDEPAVN